MCGLAGVMTRDGSAPPASVLAALRDALAHRGPDGQGMLVRGDTALIHLRLAIVDLTTGDQPLGAPGGAALVANGEIYNDPALRLEMEGTPFRTHSDCEPPVFLAEQDGAAFTERLRGMYAIAVHDPRAGPVAAGARSVRHQTIILHTDPDPVRLRLRAAVRCWPPGWRRALLMRASAMNCCN